MQTHHIPIIFRENDRVIWDFISKSGDMKSKLPISSKNDRLGAYTCCETVRKVPGRHVLLQSDSGRSYRNGRFNLNSSLAHISNMSLDFLLFVHGRPSILLIFFFFGGVVDIACIDTVGFNLTFTS